MALTLTLDTDGWSVADELLLDSDELGLALACFVRGLTRMDEAERVRVLEDVRHHADKELGGTRERARAMRMIDALRED